MLDADSGFGGAAAALLTQIRDDYSRAPCLALGLGTLSRPNKAEAAKKAADEAEACKNESGVIVAKAEALTVQIAAGEFPGDVVAVRVPRTIFVCDAQEL